MIQVCFEFAKERILVEVNGNSLMFCDLSNFTRLAPIDGLKFSKSGVLREFPDLEDEEDWSKIALERFKKHFRSINREEKRVLYVIKELSKYGYKPLYKQKQGCRAVRLDGFQ